MKSIRRNYLLSSAIAFGLFVLFGCASTRQDWITAQVKNTPVSYNQFIARHPNSPESELAKNRILEIQSKQEWLNISSGGTIEDCKAFLAKYPNSTSVPEAKKKLEDLEAEFAWQTALKADTTDAYTSYLEAHPNSFYARPAWNRIVDKDIAGVACPGHGVGNGFQKATKEKYAQVFKAPQGSLLRDWVVKAIESTGQEIVPGCVALIVEKDGRFSATVNYASNTLWSVGRGGMIYSVGGRKAKPEGTISITYTSEGIEYDFYDSGPDKTTWERIKRTSADGRSTISKAVVKEGQVYLKTN